MAAITSVIKVSDEDLRQLFPGDADPLTTLRTLAPQADILLTLGADGEASHVVPITREQSVVAVTATYARADDLPAKRAALDAWAKLLSEVVGDAAEGSNVLEFNHQ